MKPSVSSLYQAVELQQEIPPLLIGERANSNGSKKFRELLLADDYESCLKIALEQEAKGAHIIDLCTAYAGRDELTDLTTLVKMCARSLKAPLMIDSTTPECIEACLKIYPGRCVINSINLEDGGTNLRRVCAAAREFGAVLVALTINEQGMAMTAREKLAVAREIHDIAVHEFGLRPSDLMFDCLTFTVGSGDEKLRDAAIQTLEGIKLIKQELPGCLTVLGLSNISFGLAPKPRRILNSVFLHEAVEAGLDAAIVDAAKIIPFARISEQDRQVCLNLLYDRQGDQEETPLMQFIEHFSDIDDDGFDQEETSHKTLEEQLAHQVLTGDKDGVEDILPALMQRYKPLEIINQILVPAMRHVGELFGKGEILLPFVLQSAEVMKQSVSLLEPFMEKIDADNATKVLLATVQGDVHDIGKNLVEIILSNNGYKVYNAGIKMSAEAIIAQAKEYDVDVIGLSGLLVKSAIAMQESMQQYKEAGLKTPILLGGAALTPKFVAESCVPGYDAPVVYCQDAFAGLKAVREFEQGTLTSTTYDKKKKAQKVQPAVRDASTDRTVAVPKPPFLGQRYEDDIDPQQLFPLLNKQSLIRGRWGYRSGKMAADQYQELLQNTVEPIYTQLCSSTIDQGLIQPKVSYGYFSCYAEGETLFVEADNNRYPFPFPRQASAPYRCIADYFKTKEEGGDIAGFFVATIGSKIAEKTASLYQNNEYHDYLMLHGFSVEVADALADYWHGRMRRELGLEGDKTKETKTRGYQGTRYSFGYSACPDMEVHKPLFAFLKPEKIGVSLTDTMQMVPEQTVSAIVVHHPQAKYFAV